MIEEAQIGRDVLLRASKDQISCQLGQEAVILQLQRGQYYGLNEIGAVVWKALQDGPVSVAALEEAIIQKYDIDHETCARDLGSLLSSMAAAGLIETVQ